MPYALMGSGEYLPPVEPLDAYLLSLLPQRSGAPRVVCLPTAAGREAPERIEYWSELGVAHFTRLGAKAEALPIVDRESAEDPALAQRIAQADLVYFSGGKPIYLYNTLLNTPAWAAVQQVLARGGMLAGCSAGAMVLGNHFFGIPGWHTGFGLLPAIIIPHFDELSIQIVRAMHRFAMRRGLLLGIDGSTAVVCVNGEYQVHGLGSVTLFNERTEQRFAAGDKIELGNPP